MRILFFVIFSVSIYFSVYAKEAKFVPGEYIVKFKSNKNNVSIQSKKSLVQQLGLAVKSEIRTLGFTVVKGDEEKLKLNTLRANPNIEYIEPNYIYSIDQVSTTKPNDPSLGKLWGILNVGQPDSKGKVGTPGIDVNALNAWSVQTGSSDVIVAVIDTGVNYKNKEYADNMWVNQAEKNGIKGVDDDGNGYVDDIYGWNFVKNTADPMDDQGHGSHCTGTIAAKGNDKYGIVGVAWKSKIMALKFLDENGSGTLEHALLAVDYATKNGAKIINNSWGGGGFSEALKEAIERSHQAGAIFIAAAGNNSNNNDTDEYYPAGYDVPNIVSVAAIDNRGVLADFSNFGKKNVDIAAPGVNIYSTTVKGYESWSGTSMATPHVSGVAALMAAQYPTMSGVQIKDAILNAAKPIKTLRNKVATGGYVDAYNALMQVTVGPDLNDPSNWKNSMPYSLSTEHPYKPNQKNVWEITVPNANEISLYFEKFETEYKFDLVRLYDATGKEVQVMMGPNDDTFSDAIKGNYVKIVLDSDKSIQMHGFDLTKINYR